MSIKPYPGLKIKMPIAEMQKKRRPPFLKFNRIDLGEKSRIVADMKKRGWNEDEPAWIWIEEDVLTDGNTRTESGEEAGLKEGWVEYRSYKNEHEALEDARKRQIDRRNMKDASYFQMFLTLIGVKSYYNSELDMSNPENYSSIELDKKTVAGWLGIDETKAYRIIEVTKYGDAKSLQEILDGKRKVFNVFISLTSRTRTPKKAIISKPVVQLNQETKEANKEKSSKQSLIREEGETLYIGDDWLLNYNPRIYLHPDKKIREFFTVFLQQVKALAEKIFTRGGKE